MCTSTSNNDLDREYIYVRRLIAVLTNDDSDNLIVEKLKGKNLSSLLYNAKIIDNSKNMTANKKILACVIRAIEREKRLCHKRELDQSWGRKLLKSLNCLYPGMIENEDFPAFGRDCAREGRPSHKMMKHRTLSKRTKTLSTRTQKTDCKNGVKSGCTSSVRCAKTVSETERHERLRKKSASRTESLRNKTYSCIDSIMTQKLDPSGDLLNECWKVGQRITTNCVIKSQKMVYETVRPPLLRQKKLRYFIINPGQELPTPERIELVEKKSSSTQTADSTDPPLWKLPSNLKLQDLLEAASSLINTDAQREYVRNFLKNFEPPFDLSGGFPPYVKLPMEKAYVAGEESVYGTNSESSLRSVLPAQTANDVLRQKEENVKKYVRNIVMSDPWDDTAESIISGVVNESLAYNKADYSELGACILKKLGVYPECHSFKETRNPHPHRNIPELILQCTEYFESDDNDAGKNGESTKRESEPGMDVSPSIVQMSLAEEREAAKPLNGQESQNYCFHEEDNRIPGVLNLSETSLVGVGTVDCREPNKSELAAQGDGSLDRKNLRLRQPLKTTPSGLEQDGKKCKKSSFDWRSESKLNSKPPEPKRVPAARPNRTPELKDEEVTNTGKPTRQKVSIYTLASGKNQEANVEVDDPNNEPVAIDFIPTLKPDSAAIMEPAPASNVNNNGPDRLPHFPSQKDVRHEIIETATPPPEPAQTNRKQTAEPETFEGVGGDQGKPTEPSTSKPDKNQYAKKQEKPRDKKKRHKEVSKKKARPGKHDEDPSRNCKVM